MEGNLHAVEAELWLHLVEEVLSGTCQVILAKHVVHGILAITANDLLDRELESSTRFHLRDLEHIRSEVVRRSIIKIISSNLLRMIHSRASLRRTCPRGERLMNQKPRQQTGWN